MAIYKFEEQESWIDKMDEEQFVKLREIEGKVITITDAFFYESDNIGAEGVTFKFTTDIGEFYTTSFSTVILKQFHEGLMDAVRAESQTVKVCYKKSKNGKEYPLFCNA